MVVLLGFSRLLCQEINDWIQVYGDGGYKFRYNESVPWHIEASGRLHGMTSASNGRTCLIRHQKDTILAQLLYIPLEPPLNPPSKLGVARLRPTYFIAWNRP